MIERIGRVSFRRRWLVLSIWILITAAGATAVGPLFNSLGDTNRLAGTEATQASDVITAESDHGVEFVAVVDGIDPGSSITANVLNSAVREVRAIAGVKDAAGPRPSTDGRAALISVVLVKADSQFRPFTDASARLRQLSTDLPGATVSIGGGDLIGDQANDAVEADLNRAEYLSLPVTLIVLLFVFGGIAAAGMPVLAAIATVLGAFGILMGFSLFVDLDANVVTVVSLLGLGLSIDYGLLLVARFREELLTSPDREHAIARTWRTAGRTIMFSALTVAGALTGLMMFQIPRLQALGAAGIATALVALATSLFLTASLLGILGRWVKPSKRASAAAASGAAADLERGFFARLARATQRFPALTVLGTLVVLVVVALPLMHVRLKVPQLEGLPRTIESVRVADQLGDRFGISTQAGVRLVARTTPENLDAYASRWAADPATLRVEKAEAVSANVSALIIAVRGDGQGSAAQDLVLRLRADRPSGYESWVSGDAAVLMDLEDRLRSGLPLAISITVLAMLVLLFAMTGSLIVPLKAIVMNAVSLAATFGVLTLVFQDGRLAGPLDTLTIGGLSPYMIVIVFAFAFGLSMDYEVFLLGRIKEFRDAGEDTNTSVRHGLQRSGRIITSAALLMLIVFAFFGTSKVGQLEQIGLGLFVAVLVDATLVRCLLVPATMTMLGRAAWWAPGPLKRWHDRHGLREEPDALPDRAEPELTVLP
jgi:RND superfamily putative drug exporter